jgi:hypothetical protein
MRPRQAPGVYAFQKHLAERERIEQQSVQTFDAVGKVLVTFQSQYDEWTFDVSFVNTFIEEPTPAFGSILASTDYNSIYPGYFPKVSTTVHAWTTVSNGPILAYTGATIGVVTEGWPGQNVYVTYRFSGRAMNFPANLQPNGVNF